MRRPAPRRTRILGVLLAIVALIGGIYTATDGYPLLGLLVGAVGIYGGIEVARSSQSSAARPGVRRQRH